MANIYDVFSEIDDRELNMNMYHNESIREELYDLRNLEDVHIDSEMADLGSYIKECKKFKCAVANKVNLLVLLKSDIDKEKTKFTTLNDSRHALETQHEPHEMAVILPLIDDLINTQDKNGKNQ